MIGKTRECNPILVHHEVLVLLNMLKSATDDELVNAMKKLVPEFISKNSTYERLDQADSIEDKAEVNLVNNIKPEPATKNI